MPYGDATSGSTPSATTGTTTGTTPSTISGTTPDNTPDSAPDRTAAGRPSPRRRRAPSTLWLCLHLPRLGLELFTRSLADGAAGRPVVLVAIRRVVQVNAAGRARGLTPGMSLSTAESICADLVIAWQDEARERATLERLAFWAYRFTPRVTPEFPDALLLEIAGSLRLFRGLDRLQQRIVEGMAELGYSTHPGIAPTPLAARALARSGRSPDVDALADGLVFERRAGDAGGSKGTGADGADPEGAGDGPGDDRLREAWCAAVARTVRPILAGMPLDHLDRPAAELDRFQAMGLRTLKDLLRLPRAPLGRRFGRPLVDHLDRLTGRVADPRPAVAPPETFESTVHFLEDLEHRSALAFPMQRLVGELADWLRLRQQATDRLDWQLVHPRQGRQWLRVHFATPQREAKRLLEFSRLQLEREETLPAVGSLVLRVSRLVDPEAASGGLFPRLGEDGRPGEDPALLVDRLRARLGADVCRTVLPADDHRPERAWRSARPVPPRDGAPPQGRTPQGRTPQGRTPQGRTPHRQTPRKQAGSSGRAPAPVDLPPGPRPLWLLDPPRRLTSRDGQPFWHGPLALCRGPERIDVGWWEDARPDAGMPASSPAAGEMPSVLRDYWVARHPDGAHLWLYRDGSDGSWFLHGIFS